MSTNPNINFGLITLFSIDAEAISACELLTELVGRRLPLLRKAFQLIDEPLPERLTKVIEVGGVVSPGSVRTRRGFDERKPPRGRFLLSKSSNFMYHCERPNWSCTVDKAERDDGWEVSVAVALSAPRLDDIDRHDVEEELADLVREVARDVPLVAGGADGPGQTFTLETLNRWRGAFRLGEVLFGYRWLTVVPAQLVGRMSPLESSDVVKSVVSLEGASRGGLLVVPVRPPEEMSLDELRKWKELFLPILAPQRSWRQRALFYERGLDLCDGIPPGVLPEDWTLAP